MQKYYEEPSVDVVMLVAENVIVTSGGLNEEQWTENGEGQTGFEQWGQ